jgi:hypothetical protein
MNRFVSILLIAAALFVSGCATGRVYREGPVVAAPPALTLAQIKEMTAKGVSDDTILSALRASRAVYRLTSADVLDLQQANVSQAVIDYLLSTPQLYPPQRAVRYRTYYYYYDPWPYWWWHDGYWHHDWHHHGFHHGHH